MGEDNKFVDLFNLELEYTTILAWCDDEHTFLTINNATIAIPNNDFNDFMKYLQEQKE